MALTNVRSMTEDGVMDRMRTEVLKQLKCKSTLFLLIIPHTKKGGETTSVSVIASVDTNLY
jgi:hypothetical protein